MYTHNNKSASNVSSVFVKRLDQSRVPFALPLIISCYKYVVRIGGTIKTSNYCNKIATIWNFLQLSIDFQRHMGSRVPPECSDCV